MMFRRAAIGAHFVVAPILFLALHRFDAPRGLVALYPDEALLTVGIGRLLPVLLAGLGFALLLRHAAEREQG